HRDVLVRGRVIDGVDSLFAKHSLRELRISHRAEDRAQLDAFTLRPRPDLGGDLVQGVLRLLKKDQARGPTLDDLSRKLRADRSARPADQDALITDIAVEQFLARGDDVP